MPISVGIACNKCGIVYLVSKAAGTQIGYVPRRGDPGTFVLKCTACGTTRSFFKSDLKPYTLSTRSFTIGHAKPGEFLQPELD